MEQQQNLQPNGHPTNFDTSPGLKDTFVQFKDKFNPKRKWILILLFMGNVAMIVLGALNLNNCPINANIPIFLIATGVIGIASKCVTYLLSKYQHTGIIKHVEVVLFYTENVLFILGAFWVFRVYEPSYNPKNESYCDKTAYLFAFIYLVIYFAIILAVLLGFLVFVLCIYFVVRTADRNYARDVEAA